MSQTARIKHILLALSKAGARVFRQNVGQGWVGKSYRHTGAPRSTTLNDGDVVIRQARPLHAGLCEGSSDVIGWRPLPITQDMVGGVVAQFIAVEDKSETDRATREQGAFLAAVKAAGGIAGVARSVEDALTLLSSPPAESSRAD